VQPHTSTVVILAHRIDERALLAEFELFAGGRLVYANLAPDTVRRLEEALGETSTS
jgi:uncharacterized membrane protein